MTKKTAKNPAPTGEAKIARLADFSESKPTQLSLFELIHFADRNRDQYSNTIELYDFIPKYVWGKVERVGGEFLRPIKREFVSNSQHYKVTITPAKIEDKDGVFRDYFPSKREELVEDALRKLAVEGRSVMLDDLAAVKFTLYQLQQELKNNGHSYSIAQLKDAIMVCAGTHLAVTSKDGSTVLMSSMFETIGLQTREDWKGTGKKTSAFVRFNFLVTRAINAKSYRLFNYETTMRYSSAIARQLHKRMAHHYTQADYLRPDHFYRINLTTIIRDLGLTRYEKLSNNLRDVKAALAEMEEKGVVMYHSVEKTIAAEKHKKLLDAQFIITPTREFVEEVKKANWRKKEITTAAGLGITSPPNR